jgi:hypothetical protein
MPPEAAYLLVDNGFRLVCEGGNHFIYGNGVKTVPLKRHHQLDRITANQTGSCVCA